MKKKIGGTVIIDGQFAEENSKDFMAGLYGGLYDNFVPPLTNYYRSTLKAVAGLVKKLYRRRRFNIINYNYDDYLEQWLDELGIEYSVLYNEENEITEDLSIYHPHGYLPYKAIRSEFSAYRNIVFSETEYHDLYNDPYSWAMVLQHHLYRENHFLFIGCSLSDPSLRRILDTTKIKNKTHYALMLTDGLCGVDLLIVHRHFMRMGVECIWFEDSMELVNEIERL